MYKLQFFTFIIIITDLYSAFRSEDTEAGRRNRWGDLDQMWPVGDMVDVITCAIFGDCRFRGVGVVRAVSLPSPIDFTRRLTTLVTLPCDRVISEFLS